mmetsp:Transcript_84521/g.273731  ORF Transcript_84521/g.273731 Transcript_84521/m.273731 type:complete len:215 (-) Transcript_84521:948-1592(-)
MRSQLVLAHGRTSAQWCASSEATCATQLCLGGTPSTFLGVGQPGSSTVSCPSTTPGTWARSCLPTHSARRSRCSMLCSSAKASASAMIHRRPQRCGRGRSESRAARRVPSVASTIWNPSSERVAPHTAGVLASSNGVPHVGSGQCWMSPGGSGRTCVGTWAIQHLPEGHGPCGTAQPTSQMHPSAARCSSRPHLLHGSGHHCSAPAVAVCQAMR